MFRDRVLILGLTPLAERLIRELKARPSHGFALVGVVDDHPGRSCLPLGYPVVGPYGRLKDIIRDLRPHRVVVASVDRRGKMPLRLLLESCVPRGIVVEEGAEFYERLTGKISMEALTPGQIVFSRRFRPSRIRQLAAMGLGVPVATASLVLLFPLMALIAIAIKLDSRGPVLTPHERAGLDGRPFKLLRFRVSEATGLSRVGRWLQAWKLDGLPQLLNVVRGEMNLVGPSAHHLSNYELLTLVGRNQNELTGVATSYYELRFLVRPGLTGWAQVRHGGVDSLDDAMEALKLDLFYVKHASPWLDLRILLKAFEMFVTRQRARPAAKPDSVGARAVQLNGRLHG
jgi:lipopolysaccharide/colanic/teichoic acid biosynthesis glycosyltransferase